ncbi:hypothetical protein BDR05DRAFT_431748 [Suillus weaverae]|nr:hypothetical protein BDR05DRAFT_431748 [Suillus weaverae]
MIARAPFRARVSTSFKISRNAAWCCFQVRKKRPHKINIQDEELGEVDLLLHTNHDESVTHYELQGRATDVVPVTSDALAKKSENILDGMVAKESSEEMNRTSEPDILKRVEEIVEVRGTVK